MLKLFPWIAAAAIAIPVHAEVHQATPLDVLMARVGMAHASASASPAVAGDSHDAHAHAMAMPMTWDPAPVTRDAMPTAIPAQPDAVTKTFTVTARQFQYDVSPSPIVVDQGDDVTLNISVPSNDGSSVGHGFFLENYMTQALAIARGRSATVRFIASEPGTFTYFCTVFCGDGHPGMSGILTVNAKEQIPAPTITSVSPSTGPVTGGTQITISGTGFATGATVKIGAFAATSVFVLNSSTITAATPAIAPNEQSGLPRDVVVTNPDGQSATRSGAFTYTLPALSVTSITPNSAGSAGGVTVTITGTGFTTAVLTTVTFGGFAATNVTFVSATELRATVPAHAPGTVDVIVTVGANSVTVANGFAYLNPPTIRRRAARH